VIFVTVGSHPTFIFQRLLDALVVLPLESLVVQYGPGVCPPGVGVAMPWLSFTDILEQMRRADAVVTHAGVGSIFCARQLGHTPVVMPRLQRFGETVDDHQVELANALAPTGKVVIAWKESDLSTALRVATAHVADGAAAGDELPAAVHSALRGESFNFVSSERSVGRRLLLWPRKRAGATSRR